MADDVINRYCREASRWELW